MQNKGFSTNNTWNVNGMLMDLSSPKIMGILNITPDSFYDGNRFNQVKGALEQVERMINEGADIIDVGGYSTRPGADEVSLIDEIDRVVPLLAAATRQFPKTPFSIDTFRAEVAKSALDNGATIINDITGGDHDPLLRTLAATYHTPYILMHTRGTPRNMNQHTDYHDVVRDVLGALQKKVHEFVNAGITDIAIDPGFGFAKTVEQNFELLNSLDVFKMTGKPVLAGLSRKSMIWRTLGTKPEGALNGTTALNTVALMKGANILRVHDVKEAKECVTLFNKISR